MLNTMHLKKKVMHAARKKPACHPYLSTLSAMASTPQEVHRVQLLSPVLIYFAEDAAKLGICLTKANAAETEKLR